MRGVKKSLPKPRRARQATYFVLPFALIFYIDAPPSALAAAYEGKGLTNPLTGAKIKASCPGFWGWVSGSNPDALSVYTRI